MAEYAPLLATIAIVVLIAVLYFGGALDALFGQNACDVGEGLGSAPASCTIDNDNDD